MSSIVLTSRSGPDQMLHLDIPVEQADTEFEVEVVVRPKSQAVELPPGYFDRIGAIQDESFSRPPQGHFHQPTEPTSDLFRRGYSEHGRSLRRLEQVDAERIASEYAKHIGVRPFIVEGSTLHIDLDVDKPIWHVMLTYCEPSNDLAFPDWMSINVDDATGQASHIERL